MHMRVHVYQKINLKIKLLFDKNKTKFEFHLPESSAV